MARKNTAVSPTSILNVESIQNSMRPSKTPKKINYKQIIPNKHNKYTVDKIEELADTIETLGLMQPLVVKPIDDKTYLLISGHRRHEAIKLLVEGRGLEQFANIDCILEDSVESETVSNLKLHISNITNRELSEYDKLNAISDLRELNKAAIDEGVPLKGKMKNIIADQMGLSPTQIQNYLTVIDKADDEIMAGLKNKVLTLTEALELIKKPIPPAYTAPQTPETSTPQNDNIDEVNDEHAADDHVNDEHVTPSAAEVYNSVQNKPESSDTEPEEILKFKVPEVKLTELMEAWTAFKKACDVIGSKNLYMLVSKFETKFDKQLTLMEGVSE